MRGHQRNWSTGSNVQAVISQRTVIPTDRHHSAKEKYAKNKIRTTKYTLLTFLPRNLFEQFHRLANVYFLFIVILNWIPQIEAFARYIAVIPLFSVLSATGIKDLYEDRRRAKQDKLTNNRPVQVYSPNDDRFVTTKWRLLCVGDIVQLSADEIIPADIVLLSSDHPENICFIETANLDGETNLKQRKVYQNSPGAFNVSRFDSVLECEEPNNKIYQFNGHLIEKDLPIPVDSANLLLRGCVLRNTKSVIGMVVYAGPETKAFLNNSGPRSKRSKLERQMNFQVLYCYLILLVLCTTGGLGAGLWTESQQDQGSLFLSSLTLSPALEGFLRVWTFFIILQAMVPISLYISIEIVKLFQIYFIQEDIDLYHAESNTKMLCRALNITEDLGQIDYVFSDKTGTLTQNVMVFRQCSINGTLFEHDVKAGASPTIDPGLISDGRDAYMFDMDLELSRRALASAETGQDASMEHLFLLSLAASNTVVPNMKDGKLVYEAESPDEAALVSAARVYGYTLKRRALSKVAVSINPAARLPSSLESQKRKGVSADVPDGGDGSTAEYEVLSILEFDSARKRMSVVLRFPDGTIRLLVKGADSAILPVLKKSTDSELLDTTNAHLDGFARKGLRTLVFAYKTLQEEEYEAWAHKYLQASVLFGPQKKRQISHLVEEMECELTLIGATGIEDKLQDGVPEAIEMLRNAGLKVWMLTGDKQETAVEIAATCRLITPDMRQIVLNSDSASLHYAKPNTTNNKAMHDAARAEVMAMLAENMNDVQDRDTGKGDLALIVDGPTLFYCLQSTNNLKLRFLELAERSNVVVACRSTPIQKAQVVKLVKDNRKAMTLAIGDGANDVSMIQIAHIGVGISGQEGMQAVLASDFAIAQFRFLVKLMLVHGHWSYDRLANMILYFFYKNALFVWVVFLFQLFSGFSGQLGVEQLYLQTYNLLWTSIPPIVYGVFDQDIQEHLLLSNPRLYSRGQHDRSYRGKYFPNILDSLFQGIVIFFIPYFVYRDSPNNNGLLFVGTVMFYGVVFTASVHLGLITRNFTRMHFWCFFGSIAGLFGFSFAYNSLSYSFDIVPNPYFVIHHVVSDPRFWLCNVLIIMTALGPRIVVMLYRRWFHPRLDVFVREQGVVQSRLLRRKNGLGTAWERFWDALFPYYVPEYFHLSKFNFPAKEEFRNSVHGMLLRGECYDVPVRSSSSSSSSAHKARTNVCEHEVVEMHTQRQGSQLSVDGEREQNGTATERSDSGSKDGLPSHPQPILEVLEDTM